MKLLVISDTHGDYTLALEAHSLSEPVDIIVHLGDGMSDAEMLRDHSGADVVCVAGNCDLGSGAPRELLWECDGKRILLTHGDAYRVKFGLERLKLRALEVRADLVLFGHSHIATQENYSNILFLNPGTMMNTAPDKSYAIVYVEKDSISATLHSID